MSTDIRLDPDVARAWISLPWLSYIFEAKPSGDTSIVLISGALAIIPETAPNARHEPPTIIAIANINTILILATLNLLPTFLLVELSDFFLCFIPLFP